MEQHEQKMAAISKMSLEVRVTGWRVTGDEDFLRAEPEVTEYVFEQVSQEMAV